MPRHLTALDRSYLALALRNAGIKARLRVIRNGIRVVFTGERDAVREVLNAEGYLHANGQAFGPHSFNGANEVFVRYATI